MNRKPPEDKDIRETLTAEILKRKSVTYKDILRANYGEWPLKGLDIISDEHLDDKVSIIGMGKNLLMLLASERKKRAKNNQKPPGILEMYRLVKNECTLGRGASNFMPNTIWVNRFNSERQKLYTLAHERRHSQQWRFVVQSGLMCRNVYNRLKAFKPEETIGQDGKAKTARTLTKGDMDYFMDGGEMQANLEELFAGGYPSWPHMPLNKIELWAAMTNMGLSPPQRVKDKLNVKPEYLAAKKAFACAPDFQACQTASTINFCLSFLPSERAQLAFWYVVLPELYGDMLQSFGDRLGYMRMGYPHNDQVAHTIFKPESRKIYNMGYADEETRAAIARKSKKLGKEMLSRYLDGIRKQRSDTDNVRLQKQLDIMIGQLDINLKALTPPLQRQNAPSKRNSSLQGLRL